MGLDTAVGTPNYELKSTQSRQVRAFGIYTSIGAVKSACPLTVEINALVLA